MPEGKSFLIAGAGGIGQAAALMLFEWADFPVEAVSLVDRDPQQLQDAVAFVNGDPRAIPVLVNGGGLDDPSNQPLTDAFAAADVVLDCLPGSLAPSVARRALEAGCHYVNLTECVAETEAITRLAEGARTAFLLQTGLAPGFINVLAMKLYDTFTRRHGDDVASIAMKVGALAKDAAPPHYYAFTWSEVGVATEYLRDAVVVRDGQRVTVPSLSERGRIEIDGVAYEDALTSGGAADLPDHFAGRVDRLDYKTLRHPGHYAWVDARIAEVGRDVDALERAMRTSIPRAEDDFVVVYAAVKGRDADGAEREVSRSYVVEPVEVGGRRLRAIQATTASALVEAAKYLLTGGRSGVVLQTQIDPDAFMSGTFVGRVYR